MSDRDTVAEILANRRITAEDVRVLRRAIYSDGTAEKGEIDRLFTMDEAATEQDPA